MTAGAGAGSRPRSPSTTDTASIALTTRGNHGVRQGLQHGLDDFDRGETGAKRRVDVGAELAFGIAQRNECADRDELPAGGAQSGAGVHVAVRELDGQPRQVRAHFGERGVGRGPSRTAVQAGQLRDAGRAPPVPPGHALPPALCRVVNVRIRCHASEQASVHSAWLRSKNECGAPA